MKIITKKTFLTIFFLSVLSFISTNNLFARSINFEVGDHVVITTKKKTPDDIQKFVGLAPNIADLSIETFDTGEETEILKRGGRYVFMTSYNPPICTPVKNLYGFFKNGKLVETVSFGNDDIATSCDLAGTGIHLTVPLDAPLGKYTWGAKTITGDGDDVYYPDTFVIVE